MRQQLLAFLSGETDHRSLPRNSDPAIIDGGVSCVRNCSSGRNAVGSSFASAKILLPISPL